jgi:RNA polymerase sigma-70 factor (ECF subfamily)
VNISFERIKKGSREEYQKLFYQFYPQLVNFSYRMTRNKEASEEIAQDVFIYLWEKRTTIEITSSLDSYLFAAIKNRSINYVKLELPKQQAQSDLTDAQLFVEQKEEVFPSETKLNEHINMAIAQLPKKCQEIFLLSRYAGLTYKEIADELNISQKTVENQMIIALKKLRAALKPLLDRINY